MMLSWEAGSPTARGMRGEIEDHGVEAPRSHQTERSNADT